MTKKSIELDNNRRLVIVNNGETYVCTLFKLVSGELQPLTGSDNSGSITIVGEIDSPSNFMIIAKWLGDKQAVALMNGLGGMKKE